jgi:exonuclease III
VADDGSPVPTFRPGNGPADRRLDCVWVSPDLAPHVQVTALVEGDWVSDHCPLLISLDQI